MSVESGTTIGEFLTQYKKQPIKFTDFFNKGILADEEVKLFVNDDCILNMFDDLLKKYKVKYKMTNAEFRKYKYNPHRLAHDIYGNSEYWWLILHANELDSASEFNIQNIWIYKSTLLKVLKEILVITADEKAVALKMAEEEMQKYQ